MRGQESNLRRRVQSSACCHYTTPPCNTLRSCSGSRSSRQRAVDVLRYQIGQCPLDGEQLVFDAAQRPGRNVIVLGQFRQIRPLALYALLQLLQLPFFLREQHIAVID